MKTDDIRILNLRAHCPKDIESLHARLRLSHLLGTANFSPPGLPPQAILLLRRLRAPKPLPMDSLRVPVDWEQSLRGEMERWLQSAVRPVNGRIPAGAEAVLFADYAELLACLGLLVLQPDTDSIWVWQSVVRAPFPAVDALVRLWLETPRDLPAALSHLDRWQALVPALQALSDSQTEGMIAAIKREIGFSLLPESERATSLLPVGAGETVLPVPQGEEHDSLENAEAVSTALPRWWRERPPSERALSPAAQSLLILARTIVTTSSLTQRRAVLAAIRREQQREAQPGGGKPDAPVLSSEPPPSKTQREDRFLSSQKTEQTLDAALPAEAAGEDTGKTPLQRMARKQSEIKEEVTESEHPFAMVEEKQAAEDHNKRNTNVTQNEREENALWNGLEGTPTQMGGVFYLLNLFLRCDAPACFDTEFSLSAHLSLWGLLQGFGEYLAALTPGPSPNDARSSPGRGETNASLYLSGSHVEEGEAENVLPGVCLPSPTERSEDVVGEGTGVRAADLLWEILARLDGSEPGEPVAPRLPDRDNALKAVYARLRSELDTLLEGESVSELLYRPAVIYTTQTHVDIVMPLDAIWLPARRTGLDASPGWIPDLMRVVLFHFV